jgi:type IV pilus assembly protein PilB
MEKEKQKAKVPDVEGFIRTPDLEPYFDAVLSNPIVRLVTDNDGVNHDRSMYSPMAINYFANKGFYPFCWDGIHNKLAVLVDESHGFPRFLLIPEGCDDDRVDNDNRVLCFSSSFECYEPTFMGTIPDSFKGKVSGVDDISFRFVSRQVFEGMLPYVCDPTRINMYNFQKKITDNRALGIITQDVDSVAGNMLDMILQHAVTNRATDVHIEYTGSSYRARYRVDGDLRDYPVPLDGSYYSALLAVIRIRCDLEPSEHFKPQDGQMQFACSFADESRIASYYDIRMSTIPQVDGRLNAVLRIQPKGEFKVLEDLGFSSTVTSQVSRLCMEPHGLILVTGPTGCGKTTTLYSILNKLNTNDVKILTVEDPPEIRMDGLTQVAINEKQGRTFPTMLRSFLRHDPDIILVGEIRDSETARIAIEAANTGHLVLSTLHTNDATSAIKRLGNMEGVDPADFAFSLKGVLAQRLLKTFREDIVRLLATNGHAELYSLLERGNVMKVDAGQWLNSAIGESIFPTGVLDVWDAKPDLFSGRTAITEFWKLGTKAADMIFDRNFSTLELTKIAIHEDDMLPMAVTGFEKVSNGVTSLDQLVKCVGIESIRHYHGMLSDMFFGRRG